MDKLKMHSLSHNQNNIDQLRQLFPGCVTEAKNENGIVKLAVDFDQLRQELSDSVVDVSVPCCSVRCLPPPLFA